MLRREAEKMRREYDEDMNSDESDLKERAMSRDRELRTSSI